MLMDARTFFNRREWIWWYETYHRETQRWVAEDGKNPDYVKMRDDAAETLRRLREGEELRKIFPHVSLRIARNTPRLP